MTAATGTAASTLVTLPVVLGAPAADAAADPGAKVIQLTNAERAKHGCGALTRSTKIDRAAQGYASQMSRSGRFSHNGSDGSRFDQRIRAAGYPRPGGENIATGQDSASEVVGDWMDSPGHRKNILDCTFTTIGIGHTADGFWVQDFGR
jgi:uncharacterized protein YkwD